MAEKRAKNLDELVKVKLIPSIMLNYIPPLADAMNRDIVPKDFEYTLVTVYLLKGIHRSKTQLNKIMTLQINEFNLGDHKKFSMLAPHRYLTRKKGKKSSIIPQPWTMDPAQSTILNIMKIPHFGRHQKVNKYVKLLLSSFHGGYLWLDRCITIDLALIHWIIELNIQGPDLQDFYPGKATENSLAQNIKDTYGDVDKGRQG
jgi:hypothetical protein